MMINTFIYYKLAKFITCLTEYVPQRICLNFIYFFRFEKRACKFVEFIMYMDIAREERTLIEYFL